MTEEDTFNKLRRISYKELTENVSKMYLPELINYVESNKWTWREYLECVFADSSCNIQESREEFMNRWLNTYDKNLYR